MVFVRLKIADKGQMQSLVKAII